MITFRFLNKDELQSYVSSSEFEQMPHLPITVHRARSHWSNPKVTEAYPLLLLAETAGELMGYLGVMPEWVHGQSEVPIACGWLTCMWVSAKARGQGLAGQLLVKMNEAYDGRVLLADYVPATIRVYEKTKSFTGPLSLSGLRLYIQADFKTIITARYPRYAKYKSLFAIGDALLNPLIGLRRQFRKIPKANFEILTKLDQATKDFISIHSQKSSFGRDANDLQWMNDYPWVLNGDPNDPLNQRYEFSAIDRYFKNYFVRVNDEQGQLIGFLFFTHRNDYLKIPHAYFEEKDAPQIARAIEQCILLWHVKTCTLFHPALVDHFRLHGKVAFWKRAIYRKYLFSKGFAKAVDIDRLKIQDGDGDVGFT